jgi:hypothetical protein
MFDSEKLLDAHPHLSFNLGEFTKPQNKQLVPPSKEIF